MPCTLHRKTNNNWSVVAILWRHSFTSHIQCMHAQNVIGLSHQLFVFAEKSMEMLRLPFPHRCRMHFRNSRYNFIVNSISTLFSRVSLAKLRALPGCNGVIFSAKFCRLIPGIRRCHLIFDIFQSLCITQRDSGNGIYPVCNSSILDMNKIANLLDPAYSDSD